jgi:moderate conductance mechanosensitive channel
MATLSLALGPLLASAGVGGIALAFGAQPLLKDVLSGILMIIEDQYGVGDVIDTGEAIGTVEDVTLRVTRVRDASGVV